MQYLIGFLGVGSIIVGLIGVGIGNRAIVIIGSLMLLACLILCVLDTVLVGYKGVKAKQRSQASNWFSLARFPKRFRQ